MDPASSGSGAEQIQSTRENMLLGIESPTPPPQQSEDEIDRKPDGDGKTPRRRVSIKLILSPQDQKKIDLRTKKEEAADILVKMKHENDEEGAKTELDKIPSFPGKFKEEMDSDDEKGLLQAKVECKEESGPPKSPLKEEDDVLAPRSIASSLSPYCQVMENPSWETSEVYHRARGPMMYLHLKNGKTFYKVHRTVILDKIPNLPLIYYDLDDEDEDEHTLDASLHNVNLLMYWLYHEKLPPLVKIERAGIFEGMTWDGVEFCSFATKLSAFKLMDCISKVYSFPGQLREPV